MLEKISDASHAGGGSRATMKCAIGKVAVIFHTTKTRGEKVGLSGVLLIGRLMHYSLLLSLSVGRLLGRSEAPAAGDGVLHRFIQSYSRIVAVTANIYSLRVCRKSRARRTLKIQESVVDCVMRVLGH